MQGIMLNKSAVLVTTNTPVFSVSLSPYDILFASPDTKPILSISKPKAQLLYKLRL